MNNENSDHTGFRIRLKHPDNDVFNKWNSNFESLKEIRQKLNDIYRPLMIKVVSHKIQAFAIHSQVKMNDRKYFEVQYIEPLDLEKFYNERSPDIEFHA